MAALAEVAWVEIYFYNHDIIPGHYVRLSEKLLALLVEEIHQQDLLNPNLANLLDTVAVQ